MGVSLGVTSSQPFVIFAEMQQIPVHFDQHLFCQFMGELRFEVRYFAVTALFRALVFLLVAQRVELRPIHRSTLFKKSSLKFLHYSESSDVGQPPMPVLIFDKIAHKFVEFDAALESHVIDDLLEVR